MTEGKIDMYLLWCVRCGAAIRTSKTEGIACRCGQINNIVTPLDLMKGEKR